MQNLVRTIISALVDYPEAVEVQQVDGETTCILEVRVAPEDIGKVIGRQFVLLTVTGISRVRSAKFSGIGTTRK